MVSHLHTVIVPLYHAYMVYHTHDPVYDPEQGMMVTPHSDYIDTIDYSEVCDACLEDLKEGKYL